MRRNLILLGLVLLASFAKAQISLTSADFLSFYAIGNSHLVFHTDTAKTSMDVGTASSSSQSWTLPSVVYTDTTLFSNVDPVSADVTSNSFVSASDFPRATHARMVVYLSSGHTSYHSLFSRITSDSLISLGEYRYTQTAGNPRPSISNTYQLDELFPVLWGLSFTWRDSVGGGTTYTITNSTVSLDAYGTIIVPGGS